jgi:hypothetical protein
LILFTFNPHKNHKKTGKQLGVTAKLVLLRAVFRAENRFSALESIEFQ